MNECQPHDGALRKSAHLIVQASLQPARLATTKRPRNGRVSIADGPFVATEEQAGGFFIIETGDLREAILVASKHSAAYLGEGLGWGLEVRPIKAFKQP